MLLVCSSIVPEGYSMVWDLMMGVLMGAAGGWLLEYAVYAYALGMVACSFVVVEVS